MALRAVDESVLRDPLRKLFGADMAGIFISAKDGLVLGDLVLFDGRLSWKHRFLQFL